MMKTFAALGSSDISSSTSAITGGVGEALIATMCGLAIAIVGLAAGAEHDIAAYFCARYFGRRHYGKIYGLLYTLYGVGAGLGPFVAAWLVGETRDYSVALYSGAALFALAAVLILTLRSPPGSELRQMPA